LTNYNVLDDYNMPEDSANFDIAPLLMLAARTQMAQMMKRLAVKGFDGLTSGIEARQRANLKDDARG